MRSFGTHSTCMVCGESVPNTDKAQHRATCIAPAISALSDGQLTVVLHRHGFDTEAYATAFNDGYATAQQQGLGGAETRAWVIHRVEAILVAALGELHGAAAGVAERVADDLLSEIDFSGPDFSKDAEDTA
jgi:hypothetical protein